MDQVQLIHYVMFRFNSIDEEVRLKMTGLFCLTLHPKLNTLAIWLESFLLLLYMSKKWLYTTQLVEMCWAKMSPSHFISASI